MPFGSQYCGLLHPGYLQPVKIYILFDHRFIDPGVYKSMGWLDNLLLDMSEPTSVKRAMPHHRWPHPNNNESREQCVNETSMLWQLIGNKTYHSLELKWNNSPDSPRYAIIKKTRTQNPQVYHQRVYHYAISKGKFPGIYRLCIVSVSKVCCRSLGRSYVTVVDGYVWIH